LVRFFPRFPPYARTITIRHLLNHTSYLPVFEDVLKKRKTKTSEEAVALFSEQLELHFLPGDEWEYNNGRYVLLSHIVEKASSKEFSLSLQENIFEPVLHD